MSHPMQEHKGHKVERERVGKITAGCGRARGGMVHSDEAEDRALIRKEVKSSALKSEGKKSRHRSDKSVRRAKGGRVKHGKSGKTSVNVIVAPSAAHPPMNAPMAGAASPTPPAMPPRPPMAPPSPPAAMALPQAGLGGLPPRAKGGRVHKDIVRRLSGEKIETGKHRRHHGAMEMHGKRARGGKVSKYFGDSDMAPIKPGAKGNDFGFGKPRATGGKVEGKKSLADKKGVTGIGDRTPIQHSGNKSDTQNIGRGPVITRATGGPIYSDGRSGKDMGPNMNAGANSGVGRRDKNRLARSQHWEA